MNKFYSFFSYIKTDFFSKMLLKEKDKEDTYNYKLKCFESLLNQFEYLLICVS